MVCSHSGILLGKEDRLYQPSPDEFHNVHAERRNSGRVFHTHRGTERQKETTVYKKAGRVTSRSGQSQDSDFLCEEEDSGAREGTRSRKLVRSCGPVVPHLHAGNESTGTTHGR